MTIDRHMFMSLDAQGDQEHATRFDGQFKSTVSIMGANSWHRVTISNKQTNALRI
jgi:hypothetical protein